MGVALWPVIMVFPEDFVPTHLLQKWDGLNDSGGIWCVTGINSGQKQPVFYCSMLSEQFQLTVLSCVHLWICHQLVLESMEYVAILSNVIYYRNHPLLEPQSIRLGDQGSIPGRGIFIFSMEPVSHSFMPSGYRVWSCRGMKLTTHPHRMPKL
jgi:hypothetical protein